MKSAGQIKPPALKIVPTATTPPAGTLAIRPAVPQVGGTTGAAIAAIPHAPTAMPNDVFLAGPNPAEPEAQQVAGSAVVVGTASQPRFIRSEKGDKSYRIIGEPIAVGGQAIIYRVRDSEDREFVAKELKDPLNVAKKADVERFLREAGILKRLRHPNLVVCHDCFVSIDERGNRRLTLIEDLVQGRTVTELYIAT